MKSCDFKDKLIRYPSIAYIAHVQSHTSLESASESSTKGIYTHMLFWVRIICTILFELNIF